MTTHRTPKGVYSRNTPDFFDYHGAFAGVSQLGSAANFTSVGLYNNATDGSYLHVYRVIISTVAGSNVIAQVKPGTFGTIAFAGVPLRADQHTPPGMGYFNNGTALSSNSGFPWQIVMPSSCLPLFDAAPLFVIPPTYQLTMQNSPVNTFLFVTWYYTWLRH